MSYAHLYSRSNHILLNRSDCTLRICGNATTEVAVDPEEFVHRHREFYGQYHQHKEQLAYAATALYLGGSAALVYIDSADRAHTTLKVVFAATLFVAAVAFVAWQLCQRQLAADVVEACERLLARGIPSTSVASLDPRVYRGLHMPHFLMDEMVAFVESHRWFKGAPLSASITFFAMLASCIIVLLRLVT